MPIVFTQTADPVRRGLVDSLARPGGNATGFTPIEYGMATKWLELLKEIMPGVTRAGVLREAAIQAAYGSVRSYPDRRVPRWSELRSLGLREACEIERSIAAFASASE